MFCYYYFEECLNLFTSIYLSIVLLRYNIGYIISHKSIEIGKKILDKYPSTGYICHSSSYIITETLIILKDDPDAIP